MNDKSKMEIMRESIDPDKLKKFISKLTNEEAEYLLKSFEFNGRPKQLETIKTEKEFILLKAGRGFGKTYTGANWVKHHIYKGKNKYVNFIGPTQQSIENVMIYGDSGILNVCTKKERPIYKSSENKLIWPNGSESLLFSSQTPDSLRGPQHYKIWADELVAWTYPKETFTQACFGLRLGKNPQMLITTTPKSTDLFKELSTKENCLVISGSTYENKNNLAKIFINEIISMYEGSRLGRQEIEGEILEDNENSLWTQGNINKYRIHSINRNDLSRVIISIDPAATSNQTSDLTGIIATAKGKDNRYYVLEDCSMIGKPQDWASKSIELYKKYNADLIVAEANNGGEMIEAVIRNINQNINYKKVSATKGKIVRAEPIATLYEQGKVSHVGYFKSLEDQQTSFSGSNPNQKSPDRLDALVWGLTELSDCNNESILNYYRIKAEERKKLQNN